MHGQVLLRTPTSNANEPGTALVYATSWWNATHVDEYLQVGFCCLQLWRILADVPKRVTLHNQKLKRLPCTHLVRLQTHSAHVMTLSSEPARFHAVHQAQQH